MTIWRIFLSLYFLITVINGQAQQKDNFENLNLRLVHTVDKHTKFLLKSASSIPKSAGFNKNLKTVIFTAGYRETFEHPDGSPLAMITAYLQRTDYNVLIFDWGDYAFGDYFKVAAKTQTIAEKYAKALLDMLNNGMNVKSVHLVGHSLGAQISGYVGRSIIKNSGNRLILPRITGLDPANPGFSITSNRRYYDPINKKDAAFVDLIHTDNLVGSKTSAGTVDFFPNYFHQPGCPNGLISADELACNHRRAWQYWVESVVSSICCKVFHALKCASWDEFTKSKCKKSIVANMGLGLDLSVTGNFYLQTNKVPKYSRDEQGLVYNRELRASER